MKIFFLRLLILFIGLTIAHLGVSFFLLADLGSDPFNVMIQGLFRTEQQLFSFEFASHGRIHMLISFLIIVVLLFIAALIEGFITPMIVTSYFGL